MTIVQREPAFEIYANPGTEDDGYIEPEWRVEANDFTWCGGQGDWSYFGSWTADRSIEVVYAFRHGAEAVERQRAFAERTFMDLDPVGE